MELSGLTKLLREQRDLHMKILELQKQKTGVLLKGDAEQLGVIMNREQALLMSTANLEGRRQKLHDQLGLGDLTLKEVVETYSPDEKSELCVLFHEMSKVIFDIKKTLTINSKLLQSRLQTIQHIGSVFGLSENTVVYKKP